MAFVGLSALACLRCGAFGAGDDDDDNKVTPPPPPTGDAGADAAADGATQFAEDAQTSDGGVADAAPDAPTVRCSSTSKPIVGAKEESNNNAKLTFANTVLHAFPYAYLADTQEARCFHVSSHCRAARRSAGATRSTSARTAREIDLSKSASPVFRMSPRCYGKRGEAPDRRTHSRAL